MALFTFLLHHIQIRLHLFKASYFSIIINFINTLPSENILNFLSKINYSDIKFHLSAQMIMQT